MIIARTGLSGPSGRMQAIAAARRPSRGTKSRRPPMRLSVFLSALAGGLLSLPLLAHPPVTTGPQAPATAPLEIAPDDSVPADSVPAAPAPVAADGAHPLT